MATPKRPRDINQLAKMIVDLTTGDETETATEPNVKQRAGIDQKPYEMLIGILNARMTDDEQEAVWKIIRYLKKAELTAQGG